MSSSNTPNSNVSAAAVQGTGAAVSLTAAAKAAAATDAGLQDAIAKGYQPARILGGKVVGVWGGALLRTADGEMRPLKTGDVIKKGDVVLTTQDGIVQIEGAKTTNSALIDRVIADIGTPKPEEPTGAGIQTPGGGDNFLPGLRVDRVVEAVTPAGLGFTEVAADTEEIQFDTAADEVAAAELAALPDVFTGNEDTPIVFNPTSNDSAGNVGPLAVTSIAGQPIAVGTPVTLPQGVVTLNPNGTLTFTPNANFNGQVNFPYVATTPNGSTVTSTVTLNVTPVNDAPEGTDAIRQTYEEVPYVLQTKDFGFKDVDNDTLASVRIDTLPTNGRLTLNGQPVADDQIISAADIAAGRLQFVPDADENGTPYGSFTFSVQDSGGAFDAAPNRFTLNVDPLAETPAANNDAMKTEEGKPVVIDVLANDKTPTGTTLTVTEINGKPVTPGTPVPITDSTGQPIGTVVVTPDGKVTFTPEPNYQGPADFTYTATDGKTPVEGKVHVDVTPVNDVPLAVDDKATIEAGKPTTLDVLGNDTDPDKDPLTISEINGQPVTPGTPVELIDPVTKQPVGTVTVTPEGKITFNPAPGVEGPVTFEYTVKDPSGATDKATVTLDVGGVNDAPVAQADVGSTTEDAVLTVSAANGVIQSTATPAGRDSDVDGDTLAVSTVAFGNTAGKVGAPIAGAWGTLTLNADGSYSYVPNAAAQGLDTGESQSDVFTYTVTDPAGKTATTTLTITVTGVNDGPVAIDDSALTPVGTPVTIPVLGNDTDPDGEPLTVTQVDGKPISPGNPVSLVDPVGNPIGTVALNPDGTLTFTPAPGYEGPVDFPYTVTDGTTTDTGNVHVVVSSTNRPPVADDNFVQGIEGTPVTFDPRSNDYDPDTDPIAITQINGKPIAVGSPVTLPEGTVALNPDGTLTFTPVKNFDGPVTFEYTIADGRSGTDTAKVVIDVAPLDNSPAANDDVATTPEDTPVLVDVLANDKDLDGEPLTITEIDGKPAVVGTPVTITDDKGTPIATVTLTPEGKLNVVPAPNYTGPIEFPYTVTDGDTPVEAKVTVNVTPVNDAPVANDDKATVPGDTPTTLDVLGNDTDPDKDPLTISEINGQPVTPGTPVELIDPVTKQPVGTVTVTPEGKITFNPAPGVEGPVTFEYTVKDPSGATDKATVTLDVGGVNDAPVAQADVGSTTEDAVLTVSAANGVIQSGAAPAGRDSDVDGDTLAVSTVAFGNTSGKVGAPIAGAWGTLTLNADGSYSYVPNAAAQGLDTGESQSDVFTYTVTDPAGKTATTTLTITVTGVNDGPVAIDDSALTPVGTPVTIPVLGNDTDPDGEPLTVTQVDGKPISPGNPVSLVDPVGNPIGTVALNPDGTLTFTPAPGYEGPVDFPYTVTDGTTTDTANVHIVVGDKNRPPQAGDNVVDGQEDTPVTFDPRSNDFDPDTDPLTITEINGQPIEPGQSVDLPQGKVSMNPDGTLTFTPNADVTGPVKFDYTVEDGRGGSDVAQVTINVANTNDLPEGADKTERTPEDTPYVLKTEDFGFTDKDGDTFAGVRIDKLPAAGKLTLNGQDVGVNQFVSAQDIADGKLKYEPAANESGLPYGSFDFSVRDSQGSFDAKPNTFTLNVGELDDSPSAVNDTATTAEDTAVIVDVLKNDSDPDKDDTLSIVAINDQAVVVGQAVNISKDGVVIATVTLTADGKLSVLPAPNYNTEGKDPITFSYTITDGRTEVKAKVEVVVTPVNDGPNAVDDKATIAEDTPQVVKLVDNDSDPDNAKTDLKITNIAGQDVKPGDTVEIRDPAGKLLATVTLNANGQDVTVDPVANYVGPVNFSYTIADPQGLKDTANVTVDVGGVNDAPEARPDEGNTNEDTSLVVTAANGVIQSGLTAAGKDTDIDGDSLSVSSVAFGNVIGTVGQALQGKFGALTLNADGSYSFVPNSTANALDDGESGQDVFTYTVTDPGGKTATTTLTINVAGRNDGPVAIDDARKTDEDTPVTLNLVANDLDDDGEPLTITQINGVNVKPGDVVEISNDKGKVGDLRINADGTVTFTPVLDYNGPVDFTYTVSDGTASDEGAVRITVGPSNDAPDARDDLVQGEEDNTVTFDPVTSNDTDPDKDPLTITQVAGQPISVGNPITVPEGKVSLNPDGTLSFTPNKDFNGPVTFTYTISDGNGGTDTANIKLDIRARNDAPDAVNDIKEVTEDTPATGNVLSNDTDVDKDGLSVTGFTIDANGDGVQDNFGPGQKATLVNAAGKPIGDLTINADGSFTFNPAKDYFGPVPVATYSITDGKGGTDSATLTLGDVKPVADNPEGTDATKTTAEDTPYGVTAADFGFKDVDGDTFAAVRIDTLATNGLLKLNGVAVTLGQEISIADINAGKLQFVPDANENGAPYGSFTFSVKDSSGAFDLVPNTLTLNVTAQPDTPTGTDITKTTNEDTPYTIGKADFGFADVDGDTFKAVRVDTLPTNGTLTLNGVLVTAGQIITVADLDAGKLKFVPDANENGTPYGNFTFSVQDSTNAFDAAPNTFTLNVTPVADTPEGTDATKTTTEDTPYGVTAADFGFKDVDGDTFAGVRIDTLATNGVLKLNGVAVTVGQEISIADINAGKLQFVPDANENGAPYGSFTFSVKDSSGAFDLVPNTLTLDVTALPDTPTGTNVTKTTTEDTPYTIGKADFGFGDVDGDTFKAVRIDTLPTNGTLTLNGVAVTAGQIIAAASIDLNQLKFVPDANENGTPYGNFTFSVQDSSDTFDVAPNTFTLNVTPVADTPDSANVTRTTSEDTNYAVKLADFAFSDGDGDTFQSVLITTLPTDGKLLLNGVAIAAGAEVTVAQLNAGNLVFAPDLHESNTPYATFTFQVKDSTGALDATPNTFTMNVTAVPDAPTLTIGSKSLSIAENFEGVDLGGTYFKNTDVTTLTGGIWRTDNKAVGTSPKSVEIAQFTNTTWYGATSNGTNGTRAIELEQNPNDRSNLFTDVAVEKGEVFSFSFDAAARQRNNGADITNKTSVFYVYWEGQLVYTFNSLSGTFTNFQLDLVATQTGNARLEFIAADSDSYGALVDNIKFDLRQNTGVQGYVVNIPDIAAGLVDKDGSESLALRIEAIPVGAVLTDGVNSFTSVTGATTANITGWDLTKISLLPPAAFSGTIDLNVVATATEASNNTSLSTSKAVQLTVLADTNNQYGAAADDTLAGTANADRLWGFEGNDRLSGAAGNDTVIGGLGNDTLAGDDGNDLLDGALGTDSLTGGLGLDTLQGGKGNDTLTGNDGNDVFRWSLGDGGTAGAPARDVITDFSTSAVGGDILDLRDLLQGEDVNVTTNLHNYIDIDTTSVAGQTIIRISSTGGFTNGVYDATKEDQSITLSNINLRAALDRPNGTDLELLTLLVSRKQLIIDGV